MRHYPVEIRVKCRCRSFVRSVRDHPYFDEPDAVETRRTGRAAAFPCRTQRLGLRMQLFASDGVDDVLVAAGDGAKADAEIELVGRGGMLQRGEGRRIALIARGWPRME